MFFSEAAHKSVCKDVKHSVYIEDLFYFLFLSLIAFFFVFFIELCRVNVQPTALTILGKQLYIMQVTLMKVYSILLCLIFLAY